MDSYPKKINLTYIDQVSYLEGFHRSGWPYVLDSLLKLNNPNGVYCDTYVDRTFHWSNLDIIPYTKPWIGFVHHTFDTNFSDYNNVNLLKNEKFIESLDTCKGLFVFGKTHQTKWTQELGSRGFQNVKVFSLVHPTEFIKNYFTMDKFNANKKKKLIQIGAWLRDNYGIYALNNGKQPLKLKDSTEIAKTALIGPYMSAYFKPKHFFNIFRRPEWKKRDLVPVMTDFTLNKNQAKHGKSTDKSSSSIISVNGELPKDLVITHNSSNNDNQTGDVNDGMCREIICRDSDYGLNKYVLGSINLLKSFDKSVNLLPTLTDSGYDTLLTENIVFLKMVDASAVNTLIECIVRNTPVIVNPLPAITEILGEDYPLYFNETSEIPEFTLETINSAYLYLVNMDKSMLRIQQFMSDFTDSEIYQNL